MGSIDTEELVCKIKTLPPLNLVVQKLLAVTQKDGASADEVSAILASDQAIASKVLALVNSSFYGFPSKITTISRASVILGNKSIKNLALSFAAMDAFKDYKGRIPIQDFWSNSLAVATGSQCIAKYIKHPVPEEMFISGLLHDIGSVILSLFYPEEYEKVLDCGADTFLSSEKSILGVSHQTVGAMLLAHWQLPHVLTHAVHTHHSYEQVHTNQSMAIIAIAEFMSSLIDRNSLTTIPSDVLENSLKALKIDTEAITSLLKISYSKTLDSEKTFDLQSGSPPLLCDKNLDRTILVLAKKPFRRSILTAAIRFMGYKVHPFHPRNMHQAAKLKIDGAVFDTTLCEPHIVSSINEVLESKGTPILEINTATNIENNTPMQCECFPFALSQVNELFEGSI